MEGRGEMSALKIAAETVLMAIFALSITGCSNPDEVIYWDPWNYYTPADSAWKVLHNFQLAYQTKNLDAYMNCLDEEFEFILLEADWGFYGPDSVYYESWGRDVEEMFTTSMFNSSRAEIIDLEIDGDNEAIWYGDSTGSTLQLVRAFDLKIYYYDEDNVQQGWRAQGDAIFRCRPDENGEYRIWQWEDLSET